MARAYAYHSPYATPAKVYDHVSRKGHEVEPFQGGTVRLMYDKNFLYVAAELTDSDINNIAKADQEKLNGTGDVLMVYLKPADSPSFWECQLSPNSKKATFFFPTRGYPINPDANTIMPKMKAAAKVQGTINNYKKADSKPKTDPCLHAKAGRHFDRADHRDTGCGACGRQLSGGHRHLYRY